MQPKSGQQKSSGVEDAFELIFWYFLAQKWQKNLVRVCLELGEGGDGRPWGQGVEEVWFAQLGEEKVRVRSLY